MRAASPETPHAAAGFPERPRSRQVPEHLESDEAKRILAPPTHAVPAPADVSARQLVKQPHERAPIAVVQPCREVIRHVALAVAVNLLPQRLVAAAVEVVELP